MRRGGGGGFVLVFLCPDAISCRIPPPPPPPVFFPQVGSEVARRAKGLGMVVIAHDPYASVEKAAAVGVELVSFDDALKRGDFFSLHMPLTATTKNIFNDEAFAKIKKVCACGWVDPESLGGFLNGRGELSGMR